MSDFSRWAVYLVLVHFLIMIDRGRRVWVWDVGGGRMRNSLRNDINSARRYTPELLHVRHNEIPRY